jgi:hypothetical protein
VGGVVRETIPKSRTTKALTLMSELAWPQKASQYWKGASSAAKVMMHKHLMKYGINSYGS